jgi:hypothetical protein
VLRKARSFVRSEETKASGGKPEIAEVEDKEETLFALFKTTQIERRLSKMNKYRTRMSGHLPKGVSRIDNPEKDYYGFYVRMIGKDRSNLRKAIEKLGEELGMVPSNPMLLGYLLRKYVSE